MLDVRPRDVFLAAVGCLVLVMIYQVEMTPSAADGDPEVVVVRLKAPKPRPIVAQARDVEAEPSEYSESKKKIGPPPPAAAAQAAEKGEEDNEKDEEEENEEGKEEESRDGGNSSLSVPARDKKKDRFLKLQEGLPDLEHWHDGTRNGTRSAGEDGCHRYPAPSSTAAATTVDEESESDPDEAQSSTSTSESPSSGKPTITFFVQNPRTGGLFLSRRLDAFKSGKYDYRYVHMKTLQPRPTSSIAAYLQQMCVLTPGLKVIVYDSGATPNWFLSNWPAKTALILTGDESGRWGLYDRQRYWGPFGESDEAYFPKNDSSPFRHILLPDTIRPWFRQYYDARQTSVFGPDLLYFPLGCRTEFPLVPRSSIRPLTERCGCV
jgi:hypothetical protein